PPSLPGPPQSAGSPARKREPPPASDSGIPTVSTSAASRPAPCAPSRAAHPRSAGFPARMLPGGACLVPVRLRADATPTRPVRWPATLSTTAGCALTPAASGRAAADGRACTTGRLRGWGGSSRGSVSGSCLLHQQQAAAESLSRADPLGDESGERILAYHGGRARVAHPQMGDRRSTGRARLPRGQGLAADFVEVSQGGGEFASHPCLPLGLREWVAAGSGQEPAGFWVARPGGLDGVGDQRPSDARPGMG